MPLAATKSQAILANMKLVGERRALASAIMVFYSLFYGILAWSGLVPELTKALAAIAGVYGLAFFALVAGYFWARWYAVGVGLYGVITSAIGLWQIWNDPDAHEDGRIMVMMLMGGTHLVATLFLWGQTMSAPYDGQAAWREKFHMDDHAVQRLGRAVIRAGLSLPFILIYAFAPTPDGAILAPLVALLLAGAGLHAVVRMRTWGVLALGAAGAVMLTLVGADVAAHGMSPLVLRPAIAGAMLIASVGPFLAPITRFLTAGAQAAR